MQITQNLLILPTNSIQQRTILFKIPLITSRGLYLGTLFLLQKRKHPVKIHKNLFFISKQYRRILYGCLKIIMNLNLDAMFIKRQLSVSPFYVRVKCVD